MKKLVARVLLRGIFIFAFLFQINTLVFAADVKYMSADISAVCEDNGTAHITEVWKVNTNFGTEMYLARGNLNEQVISNLKVSADDRNYQSVENWNVNASLEDKAYKCGIIKNNANYELCWGLCFYGTRVFNISYDITNLVKECSDGSYIDQVFISKLPSPLESAKITIEKKGYRFTNDNTRMWAGSGAKGNLFVTDGKIEAKLTSSLSNGSEFAILSQFSKGIFSPEVYLDTSFQQLKDNAFKGSDYQKNYDEWKSQERNNNYVENKSIILENCILVLKSIMFLLLFGSIGVVFRLLKRKDTRISNNKFIKEYSDPNYCRELPFHDNIFASYTRLKSLRKLENECAIIGAYLLKWIQNRNVELTKVETKKFFKTKLEDAIKLNSLPEDTHLLEKELFGFMRSASNKDKILRNKDFEKWCKENFSSFDRWLKRYDEKGFSDLKEMGAIVEKDKKFIGFISYTRNEISEIGVKLTSEMFGFKKYLEDFTIINEREAKEVELWKDYIIYAQLFGIADKVSEQFRNLYPKYFEENFNLDTNAFDIIIINNLANSYVNLAHSSYVNAFNSNAQTAFEGLGGSFSGGGFSGSSGHGSSGIR